MSYFGFRLAQRITGADFNAGRANLSIREMNHPRGNLMRYEDPAEEGSRFERDEPTREELLALERDDESRRRAA